MVMATSDEMIWMQTISIASAWVGLTLPGMIEEPGSFSGRVFCAAWNGSPVIEAISLATSSPNPTGAFRPVPTAVPPIATFRSPRVACSTSVIASSRAPT